MISSESIGIDMPISRAYFAFHSSKNLTINGSAVDLEWHGSLFELNVSPRRSIFGGGLWIIVMFSWPKRGNLKNEQEN